MYMCEHATVDNAIIMRFYAHRPTYGLLTHSGYDTVKTAPLHRSYSTVKSGTVSSYGPVR